MTLQPRRKAGRATKRRDQSEQLFLEICALTAASPLSWRDCANVLAKLLAHLITQVQPEKDDEKALAILGQYLKSRRQRLKELQ